MNKFVLVTIMVLILTGATAFADSLDGRFGVTAKAGAFVPLQDDFVSGTSKSRAGFAGGGGFIYGFGGNFAAELDVSHVPSLDVEISGGKAYEANFTDISLGVQYRVASANRLVPFLGAGVDFIKGDLEHLSGARYTLDWAVGGHVNAGVDYFVTRGIALTAEVKGLYAGEGDVKGGGVKVGEYDPASITATLGIRLMLPKNAFR